MRRSSRSVRARAVVLLSCVATLLCVLSYARSAEAIPAFARAYEVPCSTCHITITRRNEFGDIFRKNGYHWPSPAAATDEEGRKPIEMKGYSAMRTLFPSKLPVGLEATLSAGLTNDRSAKNPSFGTPSLTLLLGSALGEHASFFGTLGLSRQTPNELYVHFARLLGRPELNVKVGLFEQSTTLFKANEALLTSYLLGSSSLNGHTVSQGRLGVETNGVLFGRTFWAAGLVENGDPGTSFDYYYHLEQKIGGRNLLGEQRNIDPDEATFLDKVDVTIGQWGYIGRVVGASGERLSRVGRLGFDAKIKVGRAGLWGGLMLGYDRDLVAFRNTQNVTWFAEASYQVRTWFMPMYMVQYQDSSGFMRPTRHHDLGMIFLLLENMRLRIKGSFSDDDIRNDGAEAQLLVGF